MGCRDLEGVTRNSTQETDDEVKTLSEYRLTWLRFEPDISQMKVLNVTFTQPPPYFWVRWFYGLFNDDVWEMICSLLSTSRSTQFVEDCLRPTQAVLNIQSVGLMFQQVYNSFISNNIFPQMSYFYLESSRHSVIGIFQTFRLVANVTLLN